MLVDFGWFGLVLVRSPVDPFVRLFVQPFVRISNIRVRGSEATLIPGDGALVGP